MKNFFKCSLALLLAIIMYSCDVIEPSQNGGLSGMWHLTKVDTLSTNGSKDCSAEGLYWNIEGKLLQIDKCFTRISSIDNKLYTEGLYKDDFGLDDPMVEDIEPLRPYGINSLNESFEIEKNSDGRLILKSQILRLYFRKY